MWFYFFLLNQLGFIPVEYIGSVRRPSANSGLSGQTVLTTRLSLQLHPASFALTFIISLNALTTGHLASSLFPAHTAVIRWRFILRWNVFLNICSSVWPDTSSDIMRTQAEHANSQYWIGRLTRPQEPTKLISMQN